MSKTARPAPKPKLSPKFANEAEWEGFFSFIEEDSTNLPALRSTLEAGGADVSRMEKRVAAFLALQKTKPRTSWLERARHAQSEFETKVRAKREWISSQFGGAQELMAAIRDGRLGLPLQQHAGVYFRNQVGEASTEDLKSFIDDCELLGLLSDIDASGSEGDSAEASDRGGTA